MTDTSDKNRNLLFRLSTATAMTALASACGHLPISQPAFEDMANMRAGLPADWTIAEMSGDPSAVIADYSVFGDAQLVAYIQEALENNRSLRASMEAVNQSEALLKQTRSGLWPSLRASFGASATDRDDDPSTAFDESLDFDDGTFTFGATGVYNADIMGDVSASIRSSIAGLRSTEATYELARRQLAAQVARAYFAILEQQMQLELDQATFTRAEDTYRITNARFDAGSVARDELVLGESSLAQSQASIIASEAAVRSAERALEVLLGRFPRNALDITGTLPEPPPTPPLGLPEATIRARPDVVAAEYNLIQNFASVRIARLARWPNLDATFTAAVSNGPQASTSNLFDLDGIALTIGATLAQTLFDGGAITGRIDAAEASKRAALERYGQTVIDAYAGILNALDQYETLKARGVALETASGAAAESLRLGELRYNEGSQSLLDLINVRDRADLAESQLIAIKRSQLEQWIALHQALGGQPLTPTPLATAANSAEGE